MLRTDQLLGEFETIATVYKWSGEQLLRLADSGGGAGLVFVTQDAERARRELETLALLKYPGVPECRRTIESGSGTTALVFHGAEDARPLALVHDLPEPTLRAGLVALLQTINFAHSRGIVHRRIDRSVVLVDPAGRFWLIGWAEAAAASNAPPRSSVLSEVAADLRDLARAFREALLRRPWPDPAGATIHERGPRIAAGQELIDAGVKVDRDFARVLSRLVTADPRDAYTGATDVLADLSALDATAFDPWESIRPVGTRREVARVLRLLDHTRLATSETVLHAASVEYVSADGFGKSRILAEIARVARSRNVIVLTAEGGAHGTWGGVGALARQLVQLLGRGARMCVQHEEALRHLLGERDAEPRRDGPGNGSAVADGRDPLIPLCTAAVTDLVRIAFRETPGLLVLDDEDGLSPAARQVWRSTGEFVQAINGGGGVLCALLVSASTRALPAEVGANRITIEIRPWRQRDVEKYLARAFAAPGGARDASAAIFPITGGCPSDVVGYLRELERRGSLRREGLRWRLAAPLSALPPLGGGVAEQVRRAIASCSRDAVALVECLAVARDVRLSRTSVGELCDVRGPRLAAAADAAVAAGLLVVDGAAWRIRTDAVAHKVCAAIPDERRRVLHREILNVVLDATPDALDALALHARASRDPRADAWTRDAIARARAAGEWGRALSHLDDAASLLGREFSSLEAELSRAELLTSLGRVGEVIESLRQRRAEEYPSLEVGLKSLLLLTRAYYEAREWQSVLDLVMPDTSEAPAVVAELRFIRAAAMRHIGRVNMAEREARLAAAETAGAEIDSVALARHEYEYQSALYAHVWPIARAALVAKLRIGRRAQDNRQVVVDLAKLGNAARYLVSDLRLAHAVLVRAIGVCRTAGEVGGAAKSALHGALAYTWQARGVRRRGFRHFGRSSFYAVQSGAGSLIVAARLRLISSAVASGESTYEDKRYVQMTIASRGAQFDMTLLSACENLGLCLLYFGYQEELEHLLERMIPLVRGRAHDRVLAGFACAGRMWLDEGLEATPALSLDRLSARCITKGLIACGISDLWITAVAYSALRPGFASDPWLRRFLTDGKNWARLLRNDGFPGWGAAALALSLALWIPIEHNTGDWGLLLSVVRKHKGPLPVALEWQRVLMESRELRRQGEWHQSEAMRECAEAQLDLLLGEEFGERGAQAHARWKRRMSGRSAPTAPTVGVVGGPEPAGDGAPAPAAPAVGDATLVPATWRSVVQSVVDGSASNPLVITSPHLRELQLFSETLHERTGGRDVIWSDSGGSSALRFDSRYPLVLVAPNLWPSERLRAAHEALSNRATSPTRIVTLLTVALNVFRADGPYQRSLSERMDGRIEQLEQLCGDASRRSRTFLSLVARANEAIVVEDAVVAEIVRYDWPGGLAEVERLVQALAARGRSPVTVDMLNDTGWRMRVDARDDGLLEEERQLLREVSACSCAGISQLSAAIGRPRRTVLRYLNRLVGSGSLVRTGRGRATLYRTRSAAFARRA